MTVLSCVVAERLACSTRSFSITYRVVELQAAPDAASGPTFRPWCHRSTSSGASPPAARNDWRERIRRKGLRHLLAELRLEPAI
jgi:hypothetical protein